MRTTTCVVRPFSLQSLLRMARAAEELDQSLVDLVGAIVLALMPRTFEDLNVDRREQRPKLVGLLRGAKASSSPQRIFIGTVDRGRRCRMSNLCQRSDSVARRRL